MIKCNVCSRDLTNNKGLSYHLSQVHGIKFCDYVLERDFNGVWPLCRCGCGNKVSFTGGKFLLAVDGHGSRGVKLSAQARKNIGLAQKGKKHAKEHNEKIKISVQRGYDEGTRTGEPQSKALKGVPLKPDHRRKLSKTRSAKIASGEIVINSDKISETVVRKYLNNEFKWTRGHYASNKSGQTIYYRSSWELLLARQLDDDPFVKFWEHEFTVIPYEWKGKRRYIPDFHVEWVDGCHTLVEVKPQKLRFTERNTAKREAALLYVAERGWDYCEWDTEEEFVVDEEFEKEEEEEESDDEQNDQ